MDYVPPKKAMSPAVRPRPQAVARRHEDAQVASAAQHAAAVQPHGEAAVGAQRLGSRLAQWPSSTEVAKVVYSNNAL